MNKNFDFYATCPVAMGVLPEIFQCVRINICPQIVVFTDNLVPTVRKALCDPLDGVRQAAATTFEHLHNTIGVHALDEIVPALLARLSEFNEAFELSAHNQEPSFFRRNLF